MEPCNPLDHATVEGCRKLLPFIRRLPTVERTTAAHFQYQNFKLEVVDHDNYLHCLHALESFVDARMWFPVPHTRSLLVSGSLLVSLLEILVSGSKLLCF